MADALHTCSVETGKMSKRSLHDGTEEPAKVKKLKTEDKVQDQQEPRNDGVPRKKKCALLLSYCGTGYAGMQINPNVKTIEEDLISAIHKTGAITDDAKDCIAKMSFQRAARTDKGVSAARQVVSLKMTPLPSLLPAINEHLPPQIRLIGLIKATKSFDAKGHCSGRTYEYLMPTYGFAKDYKTAVNYKITEEKLKLVNDILSLFLGTHNFHNFTKGKRFEDPSAKRYVIDLKCNEPFEKRGVEFVVLTIRGQSFMLHQIRKMIGLGVAIAREVVQRNTIDLAWQKEKVDVPKAPALGLLLDKVHYRAYNAKFGNDGIHEAIDWGEHEEEIVRFKEEYIYKHIIDTEVQEKTMMKWLRTLPEHTYGYRKMDQAGNSDTPPKNDQPSEEENSVEDKADLTEDKTLKETEAIVTTNHCKTEKNSVDKDCDQSHDNNGVDGIINAASKELSDPPVAITDSKVGMQHSGKDKDSNLSLGNNEMSSS